MRNHLKAALAAAALLVSSTGVMQAAELVMIDQRACAYCVKFHREIGPSYGATMAGQAAPLRRVSPLKKWPADLAGVRPAPFTPVFILVDNGREIGRFVGYDGASNFWNRLEPLIASLH